QWIELGNLLRDKSDPHESLVFYAGNQVWWFPRTQYLAAAHYAPMQSRAITILTRPADPNLVRDIPGKTAWLISGPLDRAPTSLLPGAQVMDQMSLSNIAVCTHVVLPPK